MSIGRLVLHVGMIGGLGLTGFTPGQPSREVLRAGAVGDGASARRGRRTGRRSRATWSGSSGS
jgi:hypothetical protein